MACAGYIMSCAGEGQLAGSCSEEDGMVTEGLLDFLEDFCDLER